ncbi:cytochrome b5-like heme/steroid binding domain-containing protein [Ochromonadaceae sp. CCMP2298]|nr:cytochrome b5-like heme/steroid binding domain-containing protein [Ochromonadaceae sp. CCMP2298]|mmetsp:Transcript_37397/g.83031  ORF Transcript_37397/g.83031 Transcript_37397/m.83031 type:complete len:130 (+) Transcript_37397:1-390(+)|eukprot:CAMPEP_0173185874 /NCGR_PEP_ID=MMETSP1141-20130122/9806_1 /TAXON_ID=483371 /ORGANISM="non described non described, Strain CCMP2298" /LENGTH=129 /DNA_ID=CAMNT_0014109469 /DNA_START=57 /DNA_END=446 /DNA_ORIENTATION=+
MSEVYTDEEVLKHNTETDCWLVIGNDSNGGERVYDITKYLNDHPGGPEIMLDLAGKNADEMFEDIGHSSEARSKMKQYLIGTLKVDPDKPKDTKKKVSATSDGKGGLNPFAIILLLLAVAAGVYFSQMK